MYTVSELCSELWKGLSDYGKIAIITAIILAIYVITKKGFFLYTAVIVFFFGIVSVYTENGNSANEAIGTLLCVGSAANFAYQIIDGSSGKIWSIIGFIVGVYIYLG